MSNSHTPHTTPNPQEEHRKQEGAVPLPGSQPSWQEQEAKEAANRARPLYINAAGDIVTLGELEDRAVYLFSTLAGMQYLINNRIESPHTTIDETSVLQAMDLILAGLERQYGGIVPDAMFQIEENSSLLTTRQGGRP